LEKILKGKVKTEKIENKEYVNVFLPWDAYHPFLPIGEEYAFFLTINNIEELGGTETIKFKPVYVRNPFDYKTSYLRVEFRSAIIIKDDKKKVIKQMKKAL
jgi:hypothetical protein